MCAHALSPIICAIFDEVEISGENVGKLSVQENRYFAATENDKLLAARYQGVRMCYCYACPLSKIVSLFAEMLSTILSSIS